MQPHIRYANSGGVNIAYQFWAKARETLCSCRDGYRTLRSWEDPTRAFTRLASFSRLILFDKRGTGLSDRVADMPGLEVRMDDVRR
jgi:pimeloyl-ACP methyl ester carboxylesterase